MLNVFKQKLQSRLQHSLEEKYKSQSLPPLELDIPADSAHGEFSCNIALRAAKALRKNPLELATEFVQVFEDALKEDGLGATMAKIEIKKPGFINFFLSPAALQDIIKQIFAEGERFGHSDLAKGKKVQIEFVSANPTGPLSVAHARQAAVGDALGNILKAVGCNVTKEYYVNDRGNQIKLLGESSKCRAYQKFDLPAGIPEGGYNGDYINAISSSTLSAASVFNVEDLKKVSDDLFREDAVKQILDIIKKELKDFGVNFDVFTRESDVATDDKIEEIIAYLGEKGFTYEKDGALWFKSTDFGDDKDRVLQKSDNTYTYLTPDIVYHKNKFDRGFDQVINMWGPDHHGYIPRLTAAVEALGREREALKVLIVQLATIFRNGKEVPMSTRAGQYISMREVLDEVGADAARFFFMMRHISAHLDFDLDLAKQQTPENPVYYVQYAHARVYSINKKADEAGISIGEKKFDLLKEPEELDLIKKLGLFPDTLEACYYQLDPYTLIAYLQDLGAVFHRFYDKHRVITEDKELSSQRLGLANATRIVIANGLKLLGVSAPRSM